MGIHQNICIGTELHEGAENAIHIAPLGASGVEFSVRIRARTTLTKTVVALWIDNVIAVDCRKVAPASADILAAFYYNRTNTEFYQPQCSKQPSWPSTNDHRMMLCFRYILKMARLKIGMLLRDGLAFGKNNNFKVKLYRAIAGINASAQLLKTSQLIWMHSSRSGYALVQMRRDDILKMRDGEIYLLQNHYSK
jgi:hypothetical protein